MNNDFELCTYYIMLRRVDNAQKLCINRISDAMKYNLFKDQMFCTLVYIILINKINVCNSNNNSSIKQPF